MKNIKVLETGCATTKTLKLNDETTKNAGIEIELEQIEDIGDIMSYDAIGTPCVVINGTVVHTAGVADRNTVEGLLVG